MFYACQTKFTDTTSVGTQDNVWKSHLNTPIYYSCNFFFTLRYRS